MTNATALETRINNAVAERDKTVSDVVALFACWLEELKPKIDIMIKHGMPFKNPKLELSHYGGIVIGSENNQALVLCDGSVYRASAVNKTKPDGYISFDDFVANHDLEIAKEGFLYVATIEKVIHSLEKDNRKRIQFLNRNKDGLEVTITHFADSGNLNRESPWKNM